MMAIYFLTVNGLIEYENINEQEDFTQTKCMYHRDLERILFFNS
jgi:hypothetical protein